MSEDKRNIVVIGGTIAGMTAAVAAAATDARVTIVSRIPLVRSSDVAIDEGIAAVLNGSYGDSVDQHVRDTLNAAGGSADEKFAHRVCEGAPTFVRFLVRAGVLFNRTTEGNLYQAKASGHTIPRVVGVDDATGQHVVRVLEEQVRRCEAKELVERKEYLVPLSIVYDEEDRCRGVVAMQRDNHACLALKADAVILADEGSATLYGDARRTSKGLVTGDDCMTTVKGLFAAGSCTDAVENIKVLSGNAIAAKLVSGADAGEAACNYVDGLTTHADELGESLFERACDREEKYNKALLERSEGENPYVLADELKDWMNKRASGERDSQALEKLAARAERVQLPDSSQWWNDSLVFTRDLRNEIARASKLF